MIYFSTFIQKVGQQLSSIFKSNKAIMVLLLLAFSVTATSQKVDLVVTGQARNAGNTATITQIPTGVPFIYDVQYAASRDTTPGNIDTDAKNAKATIVLPANLAPSDPTAFKNSVVFDASLVASATYSSATNTISVIFKNPLPIGSSGDILFTLQYANGVTPNGYAPDITTSFTADNAATTVSKPTNVIATATNNYTVSKSLKAGGAVNDVAIYNLNIHSGEASTGSLNVINPVFVDTIPTGAIYVEATKFNGSNAPVYNAASNTVTWTWPSGTVFSGYNASAYISIKYPNPPFTLGQTVTNIDNLSGNNPVTPLGTVGPRFSTSGNVPINLASPSATVSCTGAGITAATASWLDHHIIAGTNGNGFSVGWANTGNTQLDEVDITYNIDNFINLSKININPVHDGFDSITAATIYVTYNTNLHSNVVAGTYQSLGIGNGTTFTPTLATGEYITSVSFKVTGSLPIGAYEDLSYNGDLLTTGRNGTAVVGANILYNGGATNNGGTLVSNKSTGSYTYGSTTTPFTSCDNTVEVLRPQPVFHDINKNAYYADGSGNSSANFLASDTVLYKFHAYLGGTQSATNVVVTDNLNPLLKYISGSSTLISGNTSTPITPTISGQNLSYALSTIAPGQDYYITLQAIIKPGTLAQSITNTMNLTSDNAASTSPTNTNTINVITAVAFRAYKGQSGCNTGTGYVYYPNVATAQASGPVKYKITLANLGNVPADNLVMVDVFPYIGDNRGSNYFANLIAPVAVTTYPANTPIKVYYTTTSNPCASADFTSASNTGGCNTPNWSTTLPIDITSVKAIKVTSSATINPLDSIVLTWGMQAPYGVPTGNIMNNAVTYQVDRQDNGQVLLPATPAKVGMVVSCVNTLGSIGNYAWIDSSINGLQDSHAGPGINGLKVYLYQSGPSGIVGSSDQVLVDSAFTANAFSGQSGYYNFINLPTGDYYVKFPTTFQQYKLTPIVNQNPTTDLNSDIDSLTGYSELVHIDANGTGVAKDNNTIDAGYYPKGSIGDYVWKDTNHNGKQDDGATGINGAIVYLYKKNPSGIYIVVDSTITANNPTNNSPGYYNFIILHSGDYEVKFPVINNGSDSLTYQNASGVSSTANSDANVATGFTAPFTMNLLGSGLSINNPTIDAGYYTPVGSIGNYVWYDSNNDGINNEPATNGVNGITVQLYKKDNTGNFALYGTTITADSISGGNSHPGYYNFPNLLYGVYQVKFPTSIGNYPISDITNQAPQADYNNDANKATGYSGQVTINPISNNPLDENNPTIDAGYRTNIGSIGNYVWYDNIGSGLQKDTTTSSGLNGIKIYLLKDNGTGTFVKVDSTATANLGGVANLPGYYNFPNLNSGNYEVQFPTTNGKTILSPTIATVKTDGNSDANQKTGISEVVVLNTSSATPLDVNNPTIDAGYQPVGSLGNYVWYDTNGDGLQNEPASNGINAVKVILLKDNGTGTFVKVDSTTTLDSIAGGNTHPGYYNFTNLLAGNYKVQFPDSIGNYPLSDSLFTSPQADGNNDANKHGLSQVVTITPSSNGLNKDNPTIDAGYRTNIGSIGNYVWNDINGDGLQNETPENGLNGVKVILLKANGSGTLVPFDSTITKNDSHGNPGYYNFPDLNSGTYQVQFPLPTPHNLISPVNQTQQTDGNSDANPITGKSEVVVINTASSNPLDINNPTIDAGYQPVGSLGDYVWYDANNDGIQNEPASNGVNGVKVILLKQNGSGNFMPVDSMLTITDSLGNPGYYHFPQLLNGNYIVKFPTSIGNYHISDVTNQSPKVNGNNDADKATGYSGVVAIIANGTGLDKDNPTIDAGYKTNIGSIGNYVWVDTNGDGIQNESTTNGINGVTVNLLQDNGSGTFVQVATTVTANDSLGNPGYYNFPKLNSGNYEVQFPTTVNGGAITLQTTTPQTDLNSDANPSTGISPVVVLNTASTNPLDINNPTIDAGYKYSVAPNCNMTASIGVNQIAQCVTNNQYQFTGNFTGGTGPYTFLWDFNDGTYGYTQNPTHTYATAGEHDVTLIVKDSRGCEAHASTVQIYIGAKPIAAFDVYGNSGTGSGITFSSTSTISGGWLTYNWNLGNGTTSTLVNPGPIYYAPGTYIVTLIATGNFGCSDTVTKTIVVPGNGTYCTAPTASFTINNATQCLPSNAFAFTNTTISGATYVWNFGDGTTSTSNSPSHSYTSANTYSVTLIATNACGKDTITKTVTVNPLPAQPAAISGASNVVAGNVITLSTTSTGGVWSSANPAVATINTYGFVTGISAGTATISYTVTNGCGSLSVTKVVTVTAAAVLPVCVSPTADFTINTASQCLATNVFTFSNATTGTTPTYNWNFGDGTTTVSTTNAMHTYTAANTYTVTLTAVNACGTNSVTKTVTVTDIPTQPAAISGTTSVNMGANTTLTDATTGGVWASSDITIAKVNASGVVTGVAVGTATITYTVTNNCGSSSRSIVITVNPNCVSTASTTNATICSGSTYMFNGATYSTAGTYAAHLTNAAGCDSTASLVLSVTNAPIMPSAINGPNSVQVNSSVALTNTTSGGVWSSANTAIATINGAGIVSGVTMGTTTITYTVSNACGTAKTTIDISVYAAIVNPAPCTLNAGFSINNNRQCVTDNKFVFTNTTAGGTAPYSYLWDLNDGSYASTKDVTKTYAIYGDHNVTLKVTDANGCVSNAVAQQLYVGAKPHASFNILSNTGNGANTTLISSSTIASGSMTYMWDLGNGQTSTLVNPTTTYTPAPSSPYTIKLIVSSGIGSCKDTATQTYTQYATASVSVYPNPVMDVIQVSFRAASATATTVKIMDLQGRVLQIQTVTPIATGANVLATLDARGLQSGSYVVYISDVQNGFLATKTILKQ